MRTTSLSQTKSARFLPKLAEQSAEGHVQAELQAGKKLVKLFYGLTSISPLGQGDAHERIIKAIYKAAGWDLADERFLQLQGLVAAFPRASPMASPTTWRGCASRPCSRRQRHISRRCRANISAA